MSIIATEQLLNQTEPCENGWSKFVIRTVKEKKSKNDSDYSNTYVVLEATSGPGNSDRNVGRTFIHMISGKAIDSGVTDQIKLLFELLTAAYNIDDKSKVVGYQVDEKLEGKEVAAKLEDQVDTKTGQIYKKAVAFANVNIPF